MKYTAVKVIRSTVPVRGKRVTVLQPREPIGRLFVSGRANGDWTIYADEIANRELAILCSLAASAPDAVVWVRKSGEVPIWDMPGFDPCDLVMCHHSLQLPPSAWKVARWYAKTGGQLQTLSVPTPTGAFDEPPLFRQMNRPFGEDVADYSLHSQTVFITGSSPVFRTLADHFVFQDSAQQTGDHTHLFNRSKHEPREGARGDITISYVAPEHWRPIAARGDALVC